MNVKIPSKYLENAVDQLGTLPGIGKRTALRLTLHLLKKNEIEVMDFTQAIIDLKNKLFSCSSCGNIADEPTCSICINPNRDHNTICVVEDIRDVMAIESTSAYKGIYHVLDGLISPLDGVGPQDLNIQSLIDKIAREKITEIIFALSPTMEGDTTNFYLFKKLQPYSPYITTLSRGVAVGSELQYTNELTLGKSLLQRQVFKINN